jgi:SAM-dependent methyltransferase
MTTTIDPFAKFKAVQREGWGLFAPVAALTTVPAASLVKFAQLKPGATLLDVACGTGVVAVTAAAAGAKVRALDLSPVLLDHARANARTAGVDIDFAEGDVEALPYPDASFDFVLSQFGHMFAPRPEVAIAEMLRVLKPGGRIAFSTWPPDQFVGRMFALVGQYLPPPPGVAPAPAWGDPSVVRERLGDRVRDLHFDRDLMLWPTLSPAHYRAGIETTAAPVIALLNQLESQPERLAKFRAELDALSAAYTADNALRQHYLMSRATRI